MRTIETILYTYAELPTERAKERAREWYVSAIQADEYSEHPIDEFTELAKALGFTLNRTRGSRTGYAIGWDLNPIGATFAASWRAEDFNHKGALDKLLADRPANYIDRDTGETKVCEGNARTHRVAAQFRAIAEKYPAASGTVSDGRYCCIATEFDPGIDDEADDAPPIADEMNARNAFDEAVRDLAHDLATTIAAEYEYMTSEEAVAETMEANGYEFTADGHRA